MFEVDLANAELLEAEVAPADGLVDLGKRTAVIRTSDRNAFRSCRRKWNWSSHLRGNLGPKQNAAPLWFGSGFHFAMEDFHGYQRFADPADALREYYRVTKAETPDAIPDDAEELFAMGKAMLDYYQLWLSVRPNTFPTYVVDGIPQLEVNCRVEMPMDPKLLKSFGYDEAVYSLTIDRVVINPFTDELWLLDYKTAKVFNTSHFQVDSQVTTYCWAARQIYDLPVAGMLYAQHLKREIKHPRVLASGHLSTAQNQATSSLLYKAKMLELYDTLPKAPADIQEFYQKLRATEDHRQDVFIRHDYLNRSATMCQSEGQKILMEAEEMLNPNLALYPNPSYNCTNMCSFASACVSADDGGHYEDELAANFQQRAKEYDGWRKKIRWPDEVKKVQPLLDWDAI